MGNQNCYKRVPLVAHAIVKVNQRAALVIESRRQCMDIGFYEFDRKACIHQPTDDCDGGALTQVVNIGFEGGSKAVDGVVSTSLGMQRYLLNNQIRLAVVHDAGRADQPGLLRGLSNDEPRVNRDAVPAYPGTWLKNIYPWVAIRQTN